MFTKPKTIFIFRCFWFDDKNSFMKMKQRALRWPKLNVFWVLDFSDNFNYVMYASISIERINKKEYYVFIQTIKWIQKLLQDWWLLTQVLVNSVLAETNFTIKRKQCIDIWPWKIKKEKMRRKRTRDPQERAIKLQKESKKKFNEKTLVLLYIAIMFYHYLLESFRHVKKKNRVINRTTTDLSEAKPNYEAFSVVERKDQRFLLLT